MRKALLLTLLMIALLAALLPALAQNNTIALGESAEGTLRADGLSAVYTFSGGQGDTVTITLESDAFDAFLTLRGPDGDELITDDDSAGDGDARIANFSLPEAGEYTIVVDSYNRLATGDYTLSLEGILAPTPIPSPVPFVNEVFDSGLSYGQSINSTLTADASAFVYAFEGQAGETVTITATSSDFDSYLTLRSESGVVLATDDDSAGNLNASIKNFRLPADGRYTILVSSYSPGAAGAFIITLESSDQPASTPGFALPTWTPAATSTPDPSPVTSTPAPAVALDGERIEPGDSVSGAISAAVPEIHYIFSGTAGQAVTITAESNDFDTYIYLRDEVGFNLATDDDSAGNLNARIENFALPEDGTYTIVVSSFALIADGRFTLTLESGAASAVTPQPSPTAITEPTPEILASGNQIGLSLPVSGMLASSADTARYTFSGGGGQIVTITLTSSDFDPVVALLDASGTELASDDDSAGSLNARISSFVLPTAAEYSILVSSAGGGSGGAFTLRIDAAQIEPPVVETGSSITLGQSAQGTLIGGAPNTYTLAGEAGQNISIELRSEAFDAYLRVTGPDGTELAVDDDSAGSLNARIILYNLPQDGDYTISAESLDGESGDYLLTVSEVAVRLMEYTQTITAALEDATAFRFTGQAGDSVVIAASSSSFDTVLTLSLAGGGNALASDDDGGSDSNSLIGPFTLPETGDYIISVRAYSDGAGEYTLSLDRADFTEVTIDEEISVEIGENTGVSYFSFEASAGDVINVRVNSGGTVDTSLTLRDPNGYEVISDDDGGPDFDPEISRQSLDTSGTYTLVLQPFAPGSGGTVTLIVEKAALRSLSAGIQSVRLNSQRVTEVLTFSGSAGQTATLTLRALTGPNNAPYVTVTQAGVTVATANASNIGDLTFSFVIPEDGAINVEITDYTGGDVQYEVLLT